jgi:4-aminobutyrate aminotransferase-like enzyme
MSPAMIALFTTGVVLRLVRSTVIGNRDQSRPVAHVVARTGGYSEACRSRPVRMARFNTRRRLIVCFAGAYHG